MTDSPGLWSVIRRDGVGHFYVNYQATILTGTPHQRESTRAKSACGQHYTDKRAGDMDGLPDFEQSKEFFRTFRPGSTWCQGCIDRLRENEVSENWLAREVSKSVERLNQLPEALRPVAPKPSPIVGDKDVKS